MEDYPRLLANFEEKFETRAVLLPTMRPINLCHLKVFPRKVIDFDDLAFNQPQHIGPPGVK
jgi:hypothetical protein